MCCSSHNSFFFCAFLAVFIRASNNATHTKKKYNKDQCEIWEILNVRVRYTAYYRIWFCDLQLGLRCFFFSSSSFLFTYSIHSLSLFFYIAFLFRTRRYCSHIFIFFSEENTIQICFLYHFFCCLLKEIEL